jgi:hypothetical protein
MGRGPRKKALKWGAKGALTTRGEKMRSRAPMRAKEFLKYYWDQGVYQVSYYLLNVCLIDSMSYTSVRYHSPQRRSRLSK